MRPLKKADIVREEIAQLSQPLDNLGILETAGVRPEPSPRPVHGIVLATDGIDPLRNALIVRLMGRAGRTRTATAAVAAAHVGQLIPGVVVLQPRVVQDVLRGYPLLRFPPEQGTNHAAGLRREAIRHGELTAADLGE